MTPGPGMDKRGARRELFARTRRLSLEARAASSAVICGWLARDDFFLRARSVYSFLALPAEPDLSPLVAAFPDKRWAFSRVTPDDHICFHEMAQVDDAIQGDHRIREPDPRRHREVSPLEADLFLIPGVGFDPIGHGRLGRGKGHYDRYLGSVRAGAEGAHLVGIAFAVQLIELLPEAHDIPMDRILTEAGWS
jgi:5,10-methenyltetrahydrofolate synthetase